jgi:hypothetical protein
MRLNILLIALFTSGPLFSQQQPQVFEPGLISDGGVFGFTLSKKGNEAFWVKSNGGRDTLVIMTSRKINGKWLPPTAAPFSGKAGVWKDIDPVFSPDDNTILFQSNRPVVGKPGRIGFDIYAVHRTKDGWSDAIHLGHEINTDASESFASMTNNKSIFFMKENPDGKGTSDIYVSVFADGEYQTPTNLGAPVNTTFRESNPFISPKGDYLIYFSSDSSGFGEVDLFIAFRKNRSWTTPQNLGAPINSGLGEFCPFFHPREKRLYFCRTIQNTNGRRKEDIHYITFDPEQYRPKK